MIICKFCGSEIEFDEKRGWIDLSNLAAATCLGRSRGLVLTLKHEPLLKGEKKMSRIDELFDKAKNFSDDELQSVWKALGSSTPNEEYEPGVAMITWMNIIYAEMDRREIPHIEKETEAEEEPYLVIIRCCDCDEEISRKEITKQVYDRKVDNIYGQIDSFGEDDFSPVVKGNTIIYFNRQCEKCQKWETERRERWNYG